MTGIEAIKEILEVTQELKAKIDTMNTSIQLIEATIKMLNNRVTNLNKPEQSVVVPVSGSNLTPTEAVSHQNKDVPSAVLPTQNRGRQLIQNQPQQPIESVIVTPDPYTTVITYKKVFGTLINGKKEPIDGLLINIYDKNNEVCATTETDPTGYWTVMLKPGRYVAELTKQGFKTANKTFEVTNGAKEIEVR